MRRRTRDEDGPRDRCPIVTASIVSELETDVRVHLTINIRRLLEDHGVESDAGAPSAEQLEHYVVTTIERCFQAKASIIAASCDWLDIEYQVRKLGGDLT
jgi:hypothetical protein